MRELHPDSDLERLIDEMNAGVESDGRFDSVDGTARGTRLAVPRQGRVTGDQPLGRLILEMERRGASDLLLIPGCLPTIRIDGALQPLQGEVVSQSALADLFDPLLTPTKRTELAETGAADFSVRLEDTSVDGGGAQSSCRVRANLHHQRGELAAALRLLPRRVPDLAELNLPANLEALGRLNKGLVLVCGPTGSGKTSTLAALIGVINRARSRHIITIEDPIEYEHENRKSLVEQIEVGSDARSFGSALRSSLRRDPDVILVGEMRDRETMSTAVTAAETGHVIFSTLHTGDTTQAVHRIVDVYPADQQQQVRQQLALSLTAIVAQQLIPRSEGNGRVPALEVLVATNAVRHHIRSGALERIYNEVHGGRNLGMTTLERSLAELVRSGEIALEEAEQRAPRLEELRRLL